MDVQAMLKYDLELELRSASTKEEDLKSVAPKPLIAPIVAKLRRKPEEGGGQHAANAARQAVVHGP